MQIQINALLHLIHAALHFAPWEVLITGVDGFELTAINRHAGSSKQIKLAIQANELGAGFTDRFAICFNGNSQSSCDPVPADPSATSLRHYVLLHVPSDGSIEPR